MSRNSVFIVAVSSLLLLVGRPIDASLFNGAGDHQTSQHGYYYTVVGGQFPNGQTVNGTAAGGAAFRYLTDDPAWLRTINVWHQDTWFDDNSGIALTLRNGGSIVYDNNGLEADAATPADPNFYNYYAGNYPTGGHGAPVAYSMSNNWDWIYSGYMKLVADTTIDSITGYFVYSGTNDGLTFGFDPSNPNIQFGMNIWSNIAGTLEPTNTGGFDGDVFDSDIFSGTYSWSDTGFDRVGSSSTLDIYRLTYTLNTPITLGPGEYWFSHDARIVPGPFSIVIWGGLALMGYLYKARRFLGA